MSIRLIPSLQTLPVEILLHILNDLDAQTILFSFRNTCRRFRAIVNDYDRYVVNFDSISKPDFDLLCRLVDPQRVTSLTLADNGETLNLIKLFLSNRNLQQFTRLRSLTLQKIEECQLKTILQRTKFCSLNSFSLQIEKSDDRRRTTTARLLSAIIANSNLAKLELHVQEGRLEKMVWPAQCSIQYLKIRNYVPFDQICIILRCLPHLKTLILNSFPSPFPRHTNLKSSLPTAIPKLTSVTFEKLSTEIDDLEQFLSLIPSLVHLKLIGYGNYCDGNRWEHFIQSHLPLLNKFEFFFNERQNFQQDLPYVKTIIATFETPFWLEEKKWFVICEAEIDNPRYIRLYSIPICVSFLSYQTKKISISTFPNINDKDNSIMDNVDTVKLDFATLMPIEYSPKENPAKPPLFRKVKRLELEFDTTRPDGWLEFVSNLIDLSTIDQVKVSSILIRRSNPFMLADMTNLFQQTSRISSVDICFGFFSRKSSLTATEICSMLPLHVKHLSVSVNNLNEIKSILERLEWLSSANFFFDYTPSWNEIKTWLDTKKKFTLYEADSFSVHVWLGRNIIQPKEIKVGNKRVKLTDEDHA